jgi:superfamily I DNA/RNA helicase
LKEIKTESELKEMENLTITTFRRDVADEIKFKVSVIVETNERALGNINTIHGICYNLLGRPKVITGKDFKIFGKEHGYEAPSKIRDQSDPEDITTGDMKTNLNFYSWMKNTCTSLFDYHLYPNLTDLKNRHDFKRFYMESEDFKNEIGKIDFSDMLTEC